MFNDGTVTWESPGGGERDRFCVGLGSAKQSNVIDLTRGPDASLKREQTTPLIYALQDETTAGIYEVKGDRLRICLARHGAWQRPDSFEPHCGSGEEAYALERVRE